MAISQTMATTQSTQPQMDPQTQSAFFTFFNEDIRNLICEYLFGRVIVNINRIPQECHYHTSLLGTCQRAYMEGIRVLYSTNVFKSSQQQGLERYMDNIKTLRWDLIRKVDLRIPLTADLWQWEYAWETLCSMQNLRFAKLRCEARAEIVDERPLGLLFRKIKDPFKKEGFFLPWALRPMLRPRMSDEANFEILFNVERRKTMGALIKELRAREMRGIRIGWVTKSTGVVEELTVPAGTRAEEIERRLAESIRQLCLAEVEDPIEWEEV